MHPATKRSSYILLTCIALNLLFWFRLPMPQTIWHLEGTLFDLPLTLLFWGGWLIVLASTFMIDHLDLFGLRQQLLGG